MQLIHRKLLIVYVVKVHVYMLIWVLIQKWEQHEIINE